MPDYLMKDSTGAIHLIGFIKLQYNCYIQYHDNNLIILSAHPVFEKYTKVELDISRMIINDKLKDTISGDKLYFTYNDIFDAYFANLAV